MKTLFGSVASYALIVSLLLTPAACKRRKTPVQQTIEETAVAPSLASTVHMGDPRAAGQLVTGFHEVENHAWRWTMRQFSVLLRPPRGAAERGAVLTLNLTVPPVVLQTEKSISLTASINGTALGEETWSKPGNYVYKRDVPANVLSGDSVRVEFVLDKAIPPGDKDVRELGIVVERVALELK
jgi:hypothetical protein